jgi:RNA polymerase sigma-70 factor (sigma-E family)
MSRARYVAAPRPLPALAAMGSAGAVLGGFEELAWPPAGATGAGDRGSDATAAVTALFSDAYPRLLGLARLVAADRAAAEDLVQDAFMALHRRWGSVRDPQAALAYLQRCVVNGARNQARARAVRERLLRARRAEPSVAGPAERAEAADERDRLVSALHRLPTRQRQVLVLRYYLDQSEAEIAQTLSISKGSVKQHAARGIASLGRAMADDR